MSITYELSVLALHQVLGERAESAFEFLEDRFSDRSQRASRALRVASERAWRCLEVALAGESWWQRCKDLLSAREEQVLRSQIQSFLRSAEAQGLPARGEDFCRKCLEELRAARKARVVPGEEPRLDEAARQARAMARYSGPARMAEVEMKALEGVAEGLQGRGYPHLAEYVALRPAGGPPLLATAVRYFFRREVEEDPKLAAGLSFDQMQGLGGNLEAGLRGLHDALAQSGGRVEQMLEGVQALLVGTHEDVRAVREEVQGLRRLMEENVRRPDAGLEVETREDVRDLRSELRRQSRQIEDLCQALRQALRQQHIAPAPAAAATPPPAETTWEEAQRLMDHCQALPAEKKRQLPELFQKVGQLQAVATAFETTRRSYLRLTGKAPLSPLFTSPPAPAASPEAAGTPPSAARPALRKIKGPLLGGVFQTPAEGAEQETPSTPDSTETPSPKVRRGGLSPLFRPPDAQDQEERS